MNTKKHFPPLKKKSIVGFVLLIISIHSSVGMCVVIQGGVDFFFWKKQLVYVHNGAIKPTKPNEATVYL